MKYGALLKQLIKESETLGEVISKIPNKNLKTEAKIVESLTKLAYLFFINNDIEISEDITDQLALIDFDNNYDYWTWIELALCLRAEIALISKNSVKREKSINLIEDALNSGEGLHKKVKHNVHLRFMSGEGVELGIDESDDDPFSLFERNLIYLMKLYKLKAFGGSSDYPLEKIDHNITNTILYLKSLIDIEGIYFFSPFH